MAVAHLLGGRDFVAGEGDRHATLRQFDRQWRGNRQSILRHVNEKQIAGFDLPACATRPGEDRCPGRLCGGAIEGLRQPIDRRVELCDQPVGCLS